MPTREEFLCFLQQKPIDTIKFDTPLDFSVCQFANPALKRHYAILQAIALDEDELRETRDETLPDEEGMNRPGVVKAIEEFKKSIYGDDSGEETLLSTKPGQYQRHTDTIKFDTPLEFSVCQFANPALQRHYAILQAIALDEDELRETRDETLPDEEGMNRPGVVKAIEEFKKSIYGDDFGEESDSGEKKEKSRKPNSRCSNSDKPSYPSRDQQSRFKGSPFWVRNTITPKTTSSSSSLDQEDQKIAMANENIVRLENDKTDQGKVMKYLQNLAHKIVSKFPEFLDEDEDEDEDATQE
ncbi:hypothetical protein F2Q69_00010634 [Brassica cretica]|uniref:Ku70/Ku80 C-terminal arm domain-containing protein n=1 Tax=Brassica cretica TaxID=69181 RepID=A0A8S9QWS4_BRACR|nr:hypothetical protein F2Q69_00010634 [Brassica cretica]